MMHAVLVELFPTTKSSTGGTAVRRSPPQSQGWAVVPAEVSAPDKLYFTDDWFRVWILKVG